MTEQKKYAQFSFEDFLWDSFFMDSIKRPVAAGIALLLVVRAWLFLPDGRPVAGIEKYTSWILGLYMYKSEKYAVKL